MSDVLKRILCLVLALVVVFSFSACRHSPVLEQKVYTADGEVDPDNQQTNNDEEHSEEDTTLPPRTTKPDVSQKADQTKVSAKEPRSNPQTRPNTNQQGQTSQRSTGTPTNNQSNTNKGSGEVPGVSEDPNSPAKAVERNAVDRADLPEDVATVAAAGEAALYVEMLGGANRLLASSASFKQNYFAQVFQDFNNVKGLWEKTGETAMTDAQFQQLLTANPEAVFYIADADSNSFQSFTEGQLATLNQRGIYTVPLSLFNTTNNIQNNVRTIGKVLGKGSKVPGAKNANDMADEYIKWMDGIIRDKEKQTFSGTRKINLDQDAVFSEDYATTEDRYADSGQYTILIHGWADDAASDVDGRGSAYAISGFARRSSPASYYLSIGGLANTAVLQPDLRTRNMPVIPMFQSTVYGNVNGDQLYSEYKTHSERMTNPTGGVYLGTDSFRTVIVDSQKTRQMIRSSDAWQNWGYNRNEISGAADYGRPNGDTIDRTNIHGDYHVIVNPTGIGSWTSGSPESPLEVLWAEQIFSLVSETDEGQLEEKAFRNIEGAIREFYLKFYGVEPSLDAMRYGME